MRAYQETYVENLKTIMKLSDLSGELPDSAEAFWSERDRKRGRIRELIREDTELLRQNLMPLLDDIVSAPEEEIRELTDFANHLMMGARQLDLVLNYTIRNALVSYARKWGKRDMLIRELYQTGMALFYMQKAIAYSGIRPYYWKMSLVFGEAASYIKVYDEIEDPDIRGYIHRALANMALAYSWKDVENTKRKLQMIRRSLKILRDPVYQEKTPSLPWNLFIYKSHQERVTAMGYLRLLSPGHTDTEVVREVLESVEYIRDYQLERSRRTGKKPALRWMAQYEIAQYHCGINTLSHLLKELEKLYMKRNSADYTDEGIEENLFIPSMYGEYLASDPVLRHQKRQVIYYMYRSTIAYVKGMSRNPLDAQLLRYLMDTAASFVEYSGSLKLKDFLIELVACRDPEEYMLCMMTAELARFLMMCVIDEAPEELVGLKGCRDTEEVRSRREELITFAYEAGILHDAGMLSINHLVNQKGRAWLEEDKIMLQTHTYAGQLIMERCESTRLYAEIALGHHRTYDEKSGYPREYTRKGRKCQIVTDMVGAALCLTERLLHSASEEELKRNLVLAFEKVEQESGKGISPLMAQILLKNQSSIVKAYGPKREKARRMTYQVLKGDFI